jgi:hypothetical protein
MITKNIARIIVTISGGNVQDVEGIPKGVEVMVRDYDNATEKYGEPSEAVYTFED